MLNVNISVLGGDKRSLYAAEYFKSKEYLTDVFCEDFPSDYHSALSRADVVFLGLPAVKDGLVNIPLSRCRLEFRELLAVCKKGAVIAAGRLTNEQRDIIEASGLRWTDYSEDEIFQLENALYTAEGALASLIQATSGSLRDMKILITGGGRISKALCSILASMPCEVCVYARNPLQRCTFALWGRETYDALGSLGDFDAVINTVPCDILTRDILSTAKEDTPIIDLSARPGYVNKEICRSLGLRLIYLPGIPLLSAPRSAGISAAMAAERMFNILK